MNDAPKPGRSCALSAVLLVLLSLVAAALGGAGVWLGLRMLGSGDGDPPTTSVRSTPAVIGAVRALARLETVAFHMERVIDMRDRQTHLFGLFASEDAVLLVAAVDVIAGIDLSGVREGDLRVDRTRGVVHLVLPPPVILSSRLDTDRTYVHSRTTDALALSAPTLETRARQEAEHTLRQAALDAGVLLRARESAERTVRTLLEGLGAREVTIAFRSE
jgi:hypothetical protein